MPNSNYWQERIQEQEEKIYSSAAKDTEKALAALYNTVIQQIRDDILKVYAEVEADKAAGVELQINDFYRNNRYWELFNTINEKLQALGEKQIKITQPAILKMYEDTQVIVEEGVPKDKVNPSFLHTKAIDGKQVLFQSWCLDGKKFSDRVWEDKAKMLAELQRQLNTCVIQGKSSWEAAKAMSKRLEVSRSNAYRLMRTEVAHAQIAAATDKYKELGFTQGKWNSDNCACPHCKEQNGRVYPLEDIKTMIPAHPNCRCSYSVVAPKRKR